MQETRKGGKRSEGDGDRDQRKNRPAQLQQQQKQRNSHKRQSLLDETGDMIVSF